MSAESPDAHPEIGPEASAARCPFLAQLEQLPRLTEARYADGIGALNEGADPMEVAARVFDQDGDMPNAEGASALFTTWGQFIDHDLSLTPEGEHEVMENPAFAHGVGRSEAMEGTGADGPREFGNAISWQIDASMVYGSNDGRVADLRAFEGGRMAMTDDPSSVHGLLPQATPETVMAGETEGPDAVYLAGDVRANENPNLLTLHTLFVREHNHWADRLAEEHPDWDDDALFEGAREIVEYQIQKITYEEWLPLLVGGATPADIEGVDHDADVDGQIALEFSTAAFRFGHTLVAQNLERTNDDGAEAASGHQDLMDAFFDPTLVREEGIDAYLRGMAGQTAQALDTKVVDALNFFLSTPDGVSGFSLPALNLMRSADHGMGSYVDVRAQLLGDLDLDALDPADFSILTSDEQVQAELASAYDTVHDVDLWVGGLAEDKVPGTMLGPLFGHIVSDQFVRTATADKTFGALDPALGETILAEVRGSGMADVIVRNSDVDHIQDDPFLMQARGLTEMLGVRGTWDDDALDLAAMDVDGGVTTEGGDDSVTVTGGSILRADVDLGEGADAFAMTSGRAEARVATGEGDDEVTVGGTARMGRIETGDGADAVELNDMARVESLSTGAGGDTVRVSGKAMAEVIDTGDGDDALHLSEGGSAQVVSMGRGDDLLTLDGSRSASLDGGDGVDVLRAGPGAEIRPDASSDGDGTIRWSDGQVTRYTDFEMVTCFTPGTLLVTATGKRAIETLRAGARVMTLDHGLQPVRWIGRTTVAAEGQLAPIRIDAGALGNTRALDVSPQHRMLLSSAHAHLLFGASEVLAPATALTDRAGVAVAEGGEVTYIHLLFDRHEVLLAEGIPSESFHPGVMAMSALNAAARAEIEALFPDLPRGGYGRHARPTLRPREARLLG